MMSTGYKAFLAVCAGAIVACAPEPAAPATSPLEGSWQLIDVTSIDTAGTAAAARPASGLMLFSGGHYALSWSDTVGNASAFKNGWFASDSEKLARFGSYLSNAGTFLVSHDTLTIFPSSAKASSYEGGKGHYTFTVSGDTLTTLLFGIETASGVPFPSYAAGARERQRFVRVK